MPRRNRSKTLVRKRCFVQMTGYEPVGAGTPASPLHSRNGAFPESLERARRGVAAGLSADGAVASWTVETWGPNWRVATDFHRFRWDDFVRADAAESDWWRFPLGIAALMEFVLTGTVVKYFIVAWRYGGFFLYPLAYRARHDAGCRSRSRALP